MSMGEEDGLSSDGGEETTMAKGPAAWAPREGTQGTVGRMLRGEGGEKPGPPVWARRDIRRRWRGGTNSNRGTRGLDTGNSRGDAAGCRNLEKMRALEANSAKTRARGPEHPAVLMGGFVRGRGKAFRANVESLTRRKRRSPRIQSGNR